MKMSLKNKLRFSYVFLILIPVTFLCVLYYRVSSKNIVDIAKKNILDVTVKNTEIIDRDLSLLQENTLQINTDRDVFDALNGLSQKSDSEILAADKKVSSILQKYFSDQYMISANIITRRYVFGDNASAKIPAPSFFDSQIYENVKEKNGRICWIPTYQAQQIFQLDFKVQCPVFFSLMNELHPVYIDPENPNDVKYLNEEVDAVLVINLDNDMMHDMFSEGDYGKLSSYCVSTTEGDIVSDTDAAEEGMREELPWLKNIGTEKSGSVIVKYKGKYVLVCYAVSKVTGWVSASITPVDALLNGVSRIQKITLFVWMILFAAAMLLSAFISKKITYPIESLVEAMRRAGTGDFSQKLPVYGADEMQYLTKKYNEMGEKIQNLIEKNYKSEIRNKESEIMALNLQLNPHFLNNTLNIINMLALEKDNYEVSQMILSLSSMLQYTFRNKKELVLFREEYMWLQNYLHIMQVRFEGKFRVVYDIDEAVFDYYVPKLLLQPLVENAIIHGFKGVQKEGELLILGSTEGGMLCLEVDDNGKGMSAEELENAKKRDERRIGIGNTIRRIQLIYGEEGHVTINSEPGTGTQIRVCFPAKS